MFFSWPNKNLCVLQVLLFIFPTFLFAQSKNVKVLGKVLSENGVPIANAEIHLTKTNILLNADERGGFTLKVPAGNFTVKASAPGYADSEIEVEASSGTVKVFIKLKPNETIMDEVVVKGAIPQSATALRTTVPLQNIPQSIAIIGQETIKQQGAFDLVTIAKNIVGLNFTGNYSGAGSSQFFNARGFELNEAQNFRWNGVMVWNWGNQYSDNIQQVEFLKGPNSILFGDVAPGGVLNFVTKKPLPEFMANIEFKSGSWGLVRPAIDVTGPITKDRTLRYRINTSYEESESFRDKVSSQRRFIAPTLSWDISPKLSLNVEAVFKKSRATDDAGLVSPDGTTEGLKTLVPNLYLGEPSRQYRYTDQSYFSTLLYELNSTWRVKGTAFYGNTTNRPFGLWFDQPNEQGDFIRRSYGFYQKAKNTTLAADVYGSFFTRSIKHQVLVGAEYQSTNYRQTNGGELSEFDQNNLYLPVDGRSIAEEPEQTPFQPYLTGLNRKGIHLQDQLSLLQEKLQVLLGLRLGRTSQGNDYIEKEIKGTPSEVYTDDIVSKTVWTPRLGVVYRIKSGHSIFASFAKGYEINSPDLFAQNYLEYASPPQTSSSQFEAGIKMVFLNKNFWATLSGFEIDKHNPYGYVYLNPDNPDYDLYNVYYNGHHRSRGIELEFNGQLQPGLSFVGGMAFTRAKVVRDPGYESGNSLPNVPKFSANGWINQNFKDRLEGLHLGTGIFYKGSFFSGIKNDPNLEIPASYTWDAAAGYSANRWGIQLNVTNITNQVSYLNPWQFNLFDVRPLRQFIVTLNYHLSEKSRR